MTNSLSGTTDATFSLVRSMDASNRPRRGEPIDTKEAFQDFVAGTFYKQMLESLRKTHGRAAYFHGGQAEQMFQGQLDQQVAEDLARDHGGQFAEPLFQVFSLHFRQPASEFRGDSPPAGASSVGKTATTGAD